MPLIINGDINKKPTNNKRTSSQRRAQSSLVNPVPESLDSVVSSLRPEKSPNANYVESKPRRSYQQDENLVVVNGQEKKIGKHSRYLLDMLTIDD